VIALPPVSPRLIGGIVAGIALVALAASWYARGRAIDALEAQQTLIVIAATEATVPADEDGKRQLLEPHEVPAAITTLRINFENADRTLRTISAGTLTARAAAQRADQALGAQLDAMQRHAADQPADEWDPWELVQ
jgi:hypothetical protein